MPKVLLFDLGGVIVPWVGIKELSRLTGYSESRITEMASKSVTFMAYEVGECSTKAFLDELNDLFSLGLSRHDLSRLWNEWVHLPYKNTRQTLLGLKGDYTLACLSNTNESHWEHLKANHNILDVFDHAYASHFLKAAKPNAEAWELCLNDMNVKASDVWFFDDTQANIDAAEKLGVKSYHVERAVGVIPKLKNLGLLE